jgi:hypothetical protein
VEDAAGAEVTPGRKYDAGKPRWSLLDLSIVEQIVAVLTYGAAKYTVGADSGDNNWQKVAPAKYHDALLRHVTAWQSGARCDEESGLPHLAHAGACLLFLMWHDRNAK